MSVDFDGNEGEDALEHNLKAASPSPDEVAVTVEKNGNEAGSKKKKHKKSRNSRNQRRSGNAQQDDNRHMKQGGNDKQDKSSSKDAKTQPKSAFTSPKIKLEPSSDGTVNGTP